MFRLPACGLYAITNESSSTPALYAAVDRALEAGVAILQYRDKSSAPALRQERARVLCDLCHTRSVPFIVNDDVELAAAVGADGVHLGRDDGDIRAARAHLGPNAVIGASCYDKLENAHNAVAVGADYVAFGRFFASGTKPTAVRATPELLREARKSLPVPLVAIGGISPRNGATLIAAGADFLAAIEGIFGTPDPAAAVRAYKALFDDPSTLQCAPAEAQR